MPLYESRISKHPKDRWPLEFDLEGVPRETAERERLLGEKRMEANLPNPVSNTFAVDYQQGYTVIDINNPPKKPYVFQEFPKILYAESGKTIIVRSEAEEKRYAKSGFTTTPPVKQAEPVISE